MTKQDILTALANNTLSVDEASALMRECDENGGVCINPVVVPVKNLGGEHGIPADNWWEKSTFSMKYISGDYRLPVVSPGDRLIMGGRKAELRIETGILELSVKDSYGGDWTTIRYTKDDILSIARLESIWHSMGINAGKQPVAIKVRAGSHGGALDIRLVFPTSTEANGFDLAMGRAGLPTFPMSIYDGQ